MDASFASFFFHFFFFLDVTRNNKSIYLFCFWAIFCYSRRPIKAFHSYVRKCALGPVQREYNTDDPPLAYAGVGFCRFSFDGRQAFFMCVVALFTLKCATNALSLPQNMKMNRYFTWPTVAWVISIRGREACAIHASACCKSHIISLKTNINITKNRKWW